MKDREYLMIPGPTPVPPKAVLAMSRPIAGHRTPEFADMYGRIVKNLQEVFQTKHDVYVFASSGTGGLEAAVANTVSPGDKVLALIAGKFGERFRDLSDIYGAQVEEMNFEWGSEVDVDAVAKKLEENKDIKIVFATQNETSTGVTHDIKALGEIVAKTDAILVVDGVSGVGAIEIKTDEWKVDILCTGSQKALMLPPGLSVVSVSPKAWKVIEENKSPNYYFSLKACKKNFDNKNFTPYTPAVSLFYGMEATLNMMMDEGMENVYARHILLAKAVRAAVRAIGLKPLAEDDCASAAITAVWSPEGISADDIRKTLKEEYNVIFAGGQSQLKGKIFRISHMGYADKMEVLIAVSALEMALSKLGYPVELGKGVKAAQEVFLGAQ